MNIAFVNNQYQLGGAETVLHQLRAGLAQAGHASTLLVAHGKTFPRGAGVTPLYPRLLCQLSHSRWHELVERWCPRALWTDRRLRRLADSAFDLVHLHNFHGDYAGVDTLAAVAARKRLVWTFHAFWGITGGCDHPKACQRYLEQCGQCPQLGQWPLGRIDTTQEQLALKRSLLAELPIEIIAPSRHLAEKVSQSPVGRRWIVHHIPNGVNPEQFGFARKHDAGWRTGLGLEAASIVVLVVNRNFRDPQKGFPLVLKALSLVSPRALQVVLVGENSAWAAAQLPPELSILQTGYLGAREAMAQWYEAADIFLFASPAENFPCVILEAMSAKCCVVATPTTGVVEQIANGEDGILAEQISGKSLGRALREALAAPHHLRSCGERARERIRREFSEEQMIRRHLALYETMLAARGHSCPEPRGVAQRPRPALEGTLPQTKVSGCRLASGGAGR